MKSLYCIKFKNPYDGHSYWLYSFRASFAVERNRGIQNTPKYLELLNTIKPFDSPEDAYSFIREFMDYSSNDWYGISDKLHLGSIYNVEEMANVEFHLVDVTHDFKEINKFKIVDIYYNYLLSSSYNSVLAERYSVVQTSDFAKEIFKRSVYNTEYNKEISTKKIYVDNLYRNFVEVRNLSGEANKRSNITKFRPKKKKQRSYHLIAL